MVGQHISHESHLRSLADGAVGKELLKVGRKEERDRLVGVQGAAHSQTLGLVVLGQVFARPREFHAGLVPADRRPRDRIRLRELM